MSIAENIAAVRSRIAAAAESAGRKPEEILLVGASKMNDAAACREAIAGGWKRTPRGPTPAPPSTSTAACSATR